MQASVCSFDILWLNWSHYVAGFVVERMICSVHADGLSIRLRSQARLILSTLRGSPLSQRILRCCVNLFKARYSHCIYAPFVNKFLSLLWRWFVTLVLVDASEGVDMSPCSLSSITRLIDVHLCKRLGLQATSSAESLDSAWILSIEGSKTATLSLSSLCQYIAKFWQSQPARNICKIISHLII
jgi:hypothetical protein